MSIIHRVVPKFSGAPQIQRAVRLVWQAGPRWTLANTALVFVQGLLPLLSLYAMKLVVDSVTTGMLAPDKDRAFAHTLWLVVLAGGATLLGTLASAIAGFVNEGQALSVTDYMQNVLHNKASEVDLEYYENPEYQDTLHRAQAEAPYRPTRIVQGLTTMGQSVISLVAIAIALVALHPGIMLVLLAGAIPGMIMRFKFINIIYEWQRRRTLTERQASYFNTMLTMSYWAKEIRLFNLSELFRGRFQRLRGQIRGERLSISKRRALSDILTQFFATVPMFACLAYIAHQAVLGRITVGALVMYFGLFQRGQGALQGVVGAILSLHEDNRFLTNLYEFLDLQPKIKEPAQPQSVPNPMRQGITFDHVSFGYSLSARQALQDVCLHIAPGEVVALVGENGSGKTTLIKLLCRLYEPSSGSISIDGTDLRQFKAADLRRHFSVVFQDYVQYELTARENIWLGNLDLAPDDERIRTAACKAGADEVINSLPKGYETILGRTFEGGEELSIGQWQKVAIARAFLRDSQLIILDEPTSALDPQAEHEVFERFRQLVKTQAAILISHRLSTVRMADRICVLDDGRIVESGTHDELMKKGGTYAHLFETQAQSYR